MAKTLVISDMFSASNLVVSSSATSAIPLSVVGIASATANLFQVSNSGSVVFAVNSSGVMVGNGSGLILSPATFPLAWHRLAGGI